MFNSVEWQMAARYLRPQRKEGFISVIAGFSLLGIALGVAALIIVMAVMNGFRNELWDRILGLNGHVLIESIGDAPIAGYDALAERLRLIDGVKRATPVIENQVMATVGRLASGAVVRGIAPEDLRKLDIVANHIVDGGLEDFEGRDAIVIGSRLARKLGLRVGDALTLVSPQGTATPFGSAPRMVAYQVVAIFEIGMSEYDSIWVYMPLNEAQIYFRMPDGVNSVEIMLDSPDLAATLIAPIQEQSPPNTYVASWQQFQSSYFTALKVERNVMFLILTLIIVVAAFNIISSMIMLVKNKGRQIGILRTMGATKGMVMRIFLIAGSSIGIAGTAIGLAIGVAFCANIEKIRQFIERLSGTEVFNPELYFLSQMPADMEASEVVTVVLVALILTVFATIPPSLRAARLNPVEALRYE